MPPPTTAAWRHAGARVGFEVAYLRTHGTGWRLEGGTTAVEAGETWMVEYLVEVDASWTTHHARITARSTSGLFHLEVEADGTGSWRVDGRTAPQLQGCLDLDLESSVLTNALPVHRLGLAPGERAEAPAAYVRVPFLAVERLAQSYERLPGEGRYAYAAPAFDVAAELRFDASGLLVSYPGLAAREV
ncbi:hypothetical protein GB883_05780 [Georgenia thermotolerans]|uniref:Uncharacterized protein n=1 Tax=Georgenia thermotolerans TaxID=527326 RepID=A0A7J5URY0_9MICO|nr:hypothetical protein GB883_05780 [Georgenia thermotolerans]